MSGGFKPGLIAAALALLGSSPASAAQVRAVFVGIDVYLYSESKVEGAGFSDLRAAVSDVAQIKAALKSGYDLDLDARAAGLAGTAKRISSALTGCAPSATLPKRG